jgi:hypothetical protein
VVSAGTVDPHVPLAREAPDRGRGAGGGLRVATSRVSAGAIDRHAPPVREATGKGPGAGGGLRVVRSRVSAARAAHPYEEARAETTVGPATEQPGPQAGKEPARVSKAGARKVGEASVQIGRTGDRKR